MSITKRYYWLKLPIDFFEDDALEWLEDQENGKAYCIFYLKLCLKSINSGGILIRKIGNTLMPYEEKKLAEITKTPIETTIIALELLKENGLLVVLKKGEIWLPRVSKMVGSETSDAERKRIERNKNKAIPESQIEGKHFPDNVRLLSGKRSPDKEVELLLRNNNSTSSDNCLMPNDVRTRIEKIFKRSDEL